MTIDEEGALVIFDELKVQNSPLEISFCVKSTFP